MPETSPSTSPALTGGAPLHQQHCRPYEGPPLAAEDHQALLDQVPGWQVDGSQPGGVLTRRYNFKNFHHTMAFVNAVAWVANMQDHHPDLAVGYNTCTVRWHTHSAGGITLNDFICAARVDALSA